jgi:hypothetical protein
VAELVVAGTADQRVVAAARAHAVVARAAVEAVVAGVAEQQVVARERADAIGVKAAVDAVRARGPAHRARGGAGGRGAQRAHREPRRNGDRGGAAAEARHADGGHSWLIGRAAPALDPHPAAVGDFVSIARKMSPALRLSPRARLDSLR